MQIFTCPFCGARNETEFHFVGEAGKVRPDTAQNISDEEWAAYLYSQRNTKGRVREVWLHRTCKEMFVMERDSVTMEVFGSEALRKSVS